MPPDPPISLPEIGYAADDPFRISIIVRLVPQLPSAWQLRAMLIGIAKLRQRSEPISLHLLRPVFDGEYDIRGLVHSIPSEDATKAASGSEIRCLDLIFSQHFGRFRI